MKIGIVGFGNFGQFLAKRILKHDIEVVATSRTDYSDSAEHMGVAFFRDMKDFVGTQPDIIILATSILSFADVVKTMPLEQLSSALFVDVLSVKTYPKEYLKRMLPNDTDILCTHPMFGPDSGKGSWDGLKFMFEKVRIRKHAVCNAFLAVFAKEGCEMIEVSCEKHDSFAASSQFITHTTGRILSHLHLKKTPIDTRGYEKLLSVVENTTNDSFDLYYGLYKFNANAKEQLRLMEDGLRELKTGLFQKAAKERDRFTIGIQGANGSFNHAASLELIEKYGLKNPEVSFLITSEAVLEALNNGEIDYGVFAIENSGSGTVLPSIYSMSKYPHEIIELHDMKLTQCLLVRPGNKVEDMKKIITHPQALKQCRLTLAEKFPHLSSDYLSDDFDTAMCAKELAEGRLPEGTVVIASKIAAELYGLEIGYEGLNDDPENHTSFVFCKRRE